MDPLLPALELLEGVVLKYWPQEAPLPAASADILAALLRVLPTITDVSHTRDSYPSKLPWPHETAGFARYCA